MQMKSIIENDFERDGTRVRIDMNPTRNIEHPIRCELMRSFICQTQIGLGDQSEARITPLFTIFGLSSMTHYPYLRQSASSCQFAFEPTGTL